MAQDLYVNLVDAGLGISTATNRTVIVTGNSVPRGVSSGVVMQNKFRKTTDVAGGFWLSNLVVGVYHFDVLKVPFSSEPTDRTEFRVLFTNTTGVAYARENMVASPNNTYPPDSVAWGAAASDRRFINRDEFTNLVTAVGGGNPNAVTNNNESAVAFQNSLTLGSHLYLGASGYKYFVSEPLATTNLYLAVQQGAFVVEAADGLVVRDGSLSASAIFGAGLGITNIPLFGVTGLTNALDWLTNNAGGFTAEDATNVVHYALTNQTPGLTPYHVNSGAQARINSRLQAHLPLRVLVIRDDQQKPDWSLKLALSKVMRRNGTRSYDSSDFYSTVNGTLGNYSNASGSATSDPIWPGITYHMGNGAAFTNASSISNGWPSTVATLHYWKQSGFGTMTIYTNNAGGAWGALATINGDNGGALAPASTNIYFPRLSEGRAYVASSGTNIAVPFVALYDTNVSAGYSFDVWSGDNYGVNVFLSSTIRSNAFRTFLASADYDLILFSDLGAPETDMPLVQTMTSGANIFADKFWTTPAAIFSDLSASNSVFTQRSNQITQAKATGQALIDALPYFLPGPIGISNGLYTTDLLHLSPAGNYYAGRIAADVLGFNAASLAPYGYSNAATATDISGKANLTGGNTWSGNQVFDTASVVSGGTFLSTGTSAGFSLGNRAGGSDQLAIYKTGSGLVKFADSTASYASAFTISNITGSIFYEADSSFGTVRIGLNSDFRYYGSARMTNVWLTATNAGNLGTDGAGKIVSKGISQSMWITSQDWMLNQNATKATGASAGTAYVNAEPYWTEWIRLDDNVAAAAMMRSMPFGDGFKTNIFTMFIAWTNSVSCYITNPITIMEYGSTRTLNTYNQAQLFTNGLNTVVCSNIWINDDRPRVFQFSHTDNTNGGSLFYLGGKLEWR